MDRAQAERRVDNLMGFYTHATVYVLVGLLLITINALTFEGVPWALFALFGWGIGLVMHALRVGAVASGRLARWREDKIAELTRGNAA